MNEVVDVPRIHTIPYMYICYYTMNATEAFGEMDVS